MTLKTLLNMLKKIEEEYPNQMEYKLLNFNHFHLDNIKKTVEIYVNPKNEK